MTFILYSFLPNSFFLFPALHWSTNSILLPSGSSLLILENFSQTFPLGNQKLLLSIIVSDVGFKGLFWSWKKNQHFFISALIILILWELFCGCLWLNKKMATYKEEQKGKLSRLIFQHNIFDTTLYYRYLHASHLFKKCKSLQLSLILSLFISSQSTKPFILQRVSNKK